MLTLKLRISGPDSAAPFVRDEEVPRVWSAAEEALLLIGMDGVGPVGVSLREVGFVLSDVCTCFTGY